MGTFFGVSVLLLLTHGGAAIAGAIFLPPLYRKLTGKKDG